MSARRARTVRRPELSQHFLRSGALASSLASLASLTSSDLVVEVGPGRGVLTAEVARRCRVIAVEIDPALCRELRRRFEDDERVSIVHGDFLEYRLPRQAGYKVLGSIPFSRTSAIVRRLLHAPVPPDDAVLVVQQEAAERFAGRPFAPESLVSLRTKPWWHVEIARRPRRRDFDPPPRVDSAVLWLARRPRPLVDATAADDYRAFVDGCFGRTGATIARCLRPVFSRPQISRLSQALRFEPSGPPSSLSFDQWLGLFRYKSLHGGRNGPSHPANLPSGSRARKRPPSSDAHVGRHARPDSG